MLAGSGRNEATSQVAQRGVRHLGSGHEATRPSKIEETIKDLPNTARGGLQVAPPGQCEYCDRRRASTAAAMRRKRKRITDE